MSTVPTTSTTLTVGSDVRPSTVTFTFNSHEGTFSPTSGTYSSATNVKVKVDKDEEYHADRAACYLNDDGHCAVCGPEAFVTMPVSTPSIPPKPSMPQMAEKIAKPYGDVAYADPGYRDGTKRYPINTPAHIRAAWAYINMPKNAAKYNEEQLKDIKDRIRAAAKHHGVEISETAASETSARMADYDQASLLAGAAPLRPPAKWFSDPHLSAPTKMTIADDGHVFGHLAQWRVCHVGIGNACVVAPKSHMNYNLFKVGTVVADDDSHIPVGKIVMGSAHANAQYGVMPARDFYDNNSMTAAVVTVGEDRFGIWVNGALTTNMTPEKIASLRASALSGDWRQVNGNLELIAALAVNSPGFPIYREQSGRAFSLQAVGVLDEPVGEETSTEFTSQTDDQDSLVAGASDEDGKSDYAARAQRLKEIQEDYDKMRRSKRLSRLSSLDSGRDESTEYRPRNPRDVALGIEQQMFRPAGARLRRLPERSHSEVDLGDNR